MQKHPSLHEFRDKSEKKNMYNFKYEPAKERAQKEQDKQKRAFLERLDYD